MTQAYSEKGRDQAPTCRTHSPVCERPTSYTNGGHGVIVTSQRPDGHAAEETKGGGSQNCPKNEISHKPVPYRFIVCQFIVQEVKNEWKNVLLVQEKVT